MMSESVDLKKVENLYQTLRKAEWQNDHTGEFDDKQMVDRITNYLVKKAKEEVNGD